MILITLACSAVALVINLIEFDAPGSVVSVAICAVAIVIGLYMLRHPSTWQRDRRD